jgi:hypothetical protein
VFFCSVSSVACVINHNLHPIHTRFKMQKRYTLSAFTLLTYAMLSNDVQLQFEKYAPGTLSAPFQNFTYVNDITPLSNWRWPIALCITYLVSVGIFDNFTHLITLPYGFIAFEDLCFEILHAWSTSDEPVLVASRTQCIPLLWIFCHAFGIC